MAAHLVIGIDFGTAYSGYAFAFVQEGKIRYRSLWPGQGGQYAKTLTQLLYAPDGKLLEWGGPAQLRVASVKRDDRGTKHHRYFKMQLREELNFNAQAKAGSKLDTLALPSIKLIADYLRCLKNQALQDIGPTAAASIEAKDILWCLTVPAIWTDAEKACMRHAAKLAGLIGEGPAEAQRLTLVLEPEAGALRSIKLDNELMSEKLKPGTRFMIVDVGGGTVDLTAHEVQPNGGLSEIAAGTGGPYGSKCVDEAFADWIKKKLGADTIDLLCERDMPAYLNWMLTSWQSLKLDYDPVRRDSRELTIPTRLWKLLPEDVLDSLTKQQGSDDVLVLDNETMDSLFRTSITGIVRCIKRQLELVGPNGVDIVFLIGGFSACPLVVNAVRECLGAQVRKLVHPPDPGAAVVEGAVLYGLNPQLIRARRMRCTYGVGVTDEFREGVDPVANRVLNPDTKLYECHNRFLPLVKRGQSIEIGKIEETTLSPSRADMKSVSLNFYAANGVPDYVDDLRKLGEVLVEMPDTTHGLSRTIRVSLEFGGTEISVKAIDNASGQPYTVELKLANDDFTYFDDLKVG